MNVRTISIMLGMGLIFSGFVQAAIYKWVDADGVVHYSDEPIRSDMKPLRHLPELSTYTPPPLPKQASPQTPVPVIDEPELPLPVSEYRQLVVISPKDQAIIARKNAHLPLFLSLDPVLKANHYLQVQLDGKWLPNHHEKTFIRLPMPSKGMHRLAVGVFDETGKELLRSATQHIHVK